LEKQIIHNKQFKKNVELKINKQALNNKTILYYGTKRFSFVAEY